jgi:hypothetical protein
MSLSLYQQYEVALRSFTRGDIDLLEKMLVEPDAVTPSEMRTNAERMGVHRGLLSAAVNLVTDPTVWLAFIMSRTFPIAGWIRGTIPKRLIGEAAEFTGLSAFARPVQDYFRGTPIPRLVALKEMREADVIRSAHPILSVLERPNWKAEMPTVSLLMEGQNPVGATPELHAIAEKLRSHMDELWGFLSKTQRITGGFTADGIRKASVRPFGSAEAPKYLRDYLPHLPIMGRESIIEVSGKRALRKLGGGSFSQAIQLRGEDVNQVWSINESDRLGSNFTRWQGFMQRIGNQINPRLFKRVRHGIPLESELGQELFVTDLNVVLPKYIASVARTYALHAPLSPFERTLATARRTLANGQIEAVVPTAEPIMVQLINGGVESTGVTFERQRVAGTNRFQDVVPAGRGNPIQLTALRHLVRAVRGDAGVDEIIFGNIFSSIGARVDRMKAQLTGRQLTEIDAAINSFERTASYRDKMNGIASYFYTTTLGLNPWSAMQNMLQPFLTTMPAIGIGNTLAGYKVLKDRLPQYFRTAALEREALKTSGMGGLARFNIAMERSFHKTFPELAEQGIKIDPRLFDLDEATLNRMVPNRSTGVLDALGRRLGPEVERAFANRDEFYRAMMQPFTQAEMSNQIVTFYGSKAALRNAAVRGEYYGLSPDMTLEQRDAMLNFEAGISTSDLQFRPGPGSRSIVQNMLPAPLRQFTGFFQRLLNHFAGSTVRGAMSNAQLEQASIFNALAGGEAGRLGRQKLLSLGTGRNMGTLARTFLYGKILKEGASQVLDIDLTGSLGITSPFNVAPDGQPFAPLPMPPLPRVLWGIGSYATTRDRKRLQPLTLPGIGDVPFPKTLVPGGIIVSRIARVMNQFRPDLGGFVDDNERLMYRGDTSDRLLAFLGVPLDKGRRARDIIERTQANRQIVREYRRRYALAAVNYNTAQMDLVANKYREQFPGHPPLAISMKDLRKYRESARIPAAQRMILTLPRSFADETMRNAMESDPSLIVAPYGFGGGQ